jgi:hypothetical protein
MSKLDQPLRLKHGLAAVAAALTLGVAGTAIAGGAGQKDAVRASAGSGVAKLDGGVHYRKDVINNIHANSQPSTIVPCPGGTKVVGGGVLTDAGFAGGRGMMINTSGPIDDDDPNGNPDDGWYGRVDAFDNAGGHDIKVWAICVG